MRHDRLLRATLGLGAVFIVAAIVFAIRGGPSPPEGASVAGSGPASGAGAALFHDRCARCHDTGDFAGWAKKHPDPGERRQWLERVLASHFSPPVEERAAILAYIQQGIPDAGD
jgi:hypothetical protein